MKCYVIGRDDCLKSTVNAHRSSKSMTMKQGQHYVFDPVACLVKAVSSVTI